MYHAVMRVLQVMSYNTTTQEKRNWQIHLLYVRHEFDECLALIEEQLKDNKYSEYAIYVKGALPASLHCGTCVNFDAIV